jgi:hypothetical protein
MNEQLLIALGRLEGKVDALLNLQKMQEEQLKNHDHRLRKLEEHKHYMVGIVAVVGAGVSLAVAVLSRFIK